MDISTQRPADPDEEHCILVGDDLKINIPCSTYRGTGYEFFLNPKRVLTDTTGLYWKMDKESFSEIKQFDTLCIGDNLDLDIYCAVYQGNRYEFTLNPLRNTDHLSDLTWKLNVPTVKNSDETQRSCLFLEDDLDLFIPYAVYYGTAYEFNLNRAIMPTVPVGLYWKIDGNTLKAH
jgi:hypothetical protein